MSANRIVKTEANYVSEADYLARLEKSPVKLEWVRGRVRAMAGASSNHATLALRLAMAINNRVGMESTCEARVSDVKVRVEAAASNYFPDVVFYCDDAEFVDDRPDWLLTPLLIAEVESDSTASIDRTEKLLNYRQIPSLRHYLLVSQRSVSIEHFHRNDRNQWIYESYNSNRDEITIDFLGISVPVAEIYRRLDLPEGINLSDETLANADD